MIPAPFLLHLHFFNFSLSIPSNSSWDAVFSILARKEGILPAELPKFAFLSRRSLSFVHKNQPEAVAGDEQVFQYKE